MNSLTDVLLSKCVALLNKWHSVIVQNILSTHLTFNSQTIDSKMGGNGILSIIGCLTNSFNLRNDIFRKTPF